MGFLSFSRTSTLSFPAAINISPSRHFHIVCAGSVLVRTQSFWTKVLSDDAHSLISIDCTNAHFALTRHIVLLLFPYHNLGRIHARHTLGQSACTRIVSMIIFHSHRVSPECHDTTHIFSQTVSVVRICSWRLSRVRHISPAHDWTRDTCTCVFW